MPSNIYTVGLQNAGSYQVAGQPYMSGSTTTNTLGSNVNGHVVFPYVTKKVKITNEATDTSHHLIVSFSPFLESEKANYGYTNSASGSGNWLFLKHGNSMELDVKCKEIFVAPATANNTAYSLYAELTNVPTARMYSLDGIEGSS